MSMIDNQLPESCDDRGKRPKSDSESESEHESDSDSESESEHESDSDSDSDSEVVWTPHSIWDTKSIEDIEISDLSSVYDNYPHPFYFACSPFVYENAAYIKREEETKKAMDEYWEISRNLSPYDAIPRPKLANTCGCRWPQPYDIDESNRSLLIGLSKLSLDYYNAHNQDTNYVFDELVKATVNVYPPVTYYITFQAKDAAHPSDSPSITFQAKVLKLMFVRGRHEVESCSIKA